MVSLPLPWPVLSITTTSRGADLLCLFKVILHIERKLCHCFPKHLYHMLPFTGDLIPPIFFSFLFISSLFSDLLCLSWGMVHKPGGDSTDHIRFPRQAAKQSSCSWGPATATAASISHTKVFRFFFSCTCSCIESWGMHTQVAKLFFPKVSLILGTNITHFQHFIFRPRIAHQVCLYGHTI